MEWVILPVLFISLIILLALGLPIAFSLGFISIIFAFILWPGTEGIFGVALAGYSEMTNYLLVCIPLFIFMAELIMYSHMGTETYDVADRFLGNLPGGLGITSVAFGTILGAVCGASTAGTATVGLLSIPEMVDRGYSKGLAGAIVGFAGAISILVPPSVILILYGAITGTSVGALFIGTIIPGIIMGGLGALLIAGIAIIRPSMAPKRVEFYTLKEKFAAIWKVWAMLLVIITLLGTIYFGIATPTEASAVAATLVFLIALVQKRLTIKILRDSLLATVRTTSMIGWIIIGAMSFGYIITYSGVAAKISSLVVNLDIPTVVIVIILMILYLILGMFLDPAAIVMMTIPIMLPVLNALNIDLLWFGVLIAINMCAGNITPPVGLNLYIVKGIRKDIELSSLFKFALPFIVIDMAVVLLVIAFPSLTTWLPSLMI